jgi:predicted  nucleic acid-binding Zn-ribbon protein
MLDVITQLLILQDCDQKILNAQAELGNIGPQRQALQSQAATVQNQLLTAKQRLKELEVQRKESETEVEAKKESIARYSLQQFQTKKNEEYRALTHEIALCQEAIVKFEDHQLELMEKAESIQKEIGSFQTAASDVTRITDSKLVELTRWEQNLERDLAELKTKRDHLAEALDAGGRSRYERLLRHKSGRILVGVDRGVCGGCHMKLPPHVVLSCQTDEDIVQCPNCSRILYFTAEMDLTPSE